MNRNMGIRVTTVIGALLLGSCGPLGDNPYHISTEQSESLSVTSILSKDGNTPLIDIASYDGETPVIHVYPNAAPTIAEVESVEVGWDNTDGNTSYSVGFKGTSNVMPLGLAITDTDGDGLADVHIAMFPRGAGFRHYFDFNADGILDAYTELEIENGEKTSHRAILVDQCWVAVSTDDTMFTHTRIATALDNPEVSYVFRDGVWHESGSDPAP